MAEARRAVEPLPSLTLESTVDSSNPIFQAHTSDHGLSLFIPHPKYILRNLWSVAKRSYLKMHQAFFPLPVPVAFGAIAGTVLFMLLLPSKSRNLRDSRISHLVWNLDAKINPFHKGFPNELRVAYLAFNTSAVVLFSFTALHRMLLRGLLSYTSWMDGERGKKSWKTKVWGFLLKYLYIRGGSKVMLAYQTSLPHFPVPSLEDTTTRYLESMTGLLDESESAIVKNEIQDFLKTAGPKLQRYLKYKWFVSENYIADWWRDFVYLRARESLMVNSNYYGTTIFGYWPSRDQASRAAFHVHLLLTLAIDVHNEKIAPQLIQNLVPLCMDQYRYTFGTTRIPGAEQDHLVTEEWSKSRHVIFMNRGRVYKFRCFDHNNKLLSAVDFYQAIRGILEDVSPACEEEKQLGALTAWERTKWAATREQQFLRHPLNRRSLESIEKSLFVVALDEEDPKYDEKELSELGMHFITGPFGNRWFDKSVNYVFTSSGYLGMNGEHSWSDAPCFGHLFEIVMAREVRQQPYNENGILKAVAQEEHNQASFTAPERLRFYFSAQLSADIREATQHAQRIKDDLDLVVLHHTAFGKGRIKKCKVGPDAFVQMALQLAYFRNQGKFVQTYESSMSRLYSLGRTETIRSCSKESCDMVNAICKGDTPREEMAKLIRAACAKHVKTTIMSMTGRGVDRHLFALYVVAIGTKTESPFLQRAMKRGWKLSTSQVPTCVVPEEWPCKDNGDVYPRSSGGFGPVADDGYGICYSISGENHIFFHVSSKKSCPITSSRKMQADIFAAMSDLANIMDPPTP